MDKYTMKKFNLSYDSLYDLKSKLNNALSNHIGILMEKMEEEVKTWGYEFKLNEKNQKWKLYKIK